MRIGHFMPGHNINGGICSYIRRVSTAQLESGHEVFLFDRMGYVMPGEEGRLIITRDDAELFRLSSEHRLDILHLHSVADLSRAPVKTVRTLHVHWPYCPSGSQFLGRQNKACDRAYSFLGCAWGHVVDRCGSVRPARFSEDFTRTWQEMRTLPMTRVLPVSEFLKSQMVRSGYDGDNIHVLRLPAPPLRQHDSPRFSRASEVIPSFLFLGRLVLSKGVEWLVRAAAEVKGDFSLQIAGVGPERERLIALCSQLGIEKKAHFHPWLDESKTFELIRNCRAVIFPSTWHEPSGTVMLEAAAHGRALIASRVGGIPEYTAALGNAIMVDPNDIPALAQAIQRLLDNPAEAQRLGEQGYRSVQHGPLTFKSHMATLQQHYEEVMGLRSRLPATVHEKKSLGSP